MPGTYKIARRLDKNKQADLFVRLAKSIAALRNSEEAAYFLKDLLSEAEAVMLAKRLQIAEFLVSGQTYEQIRSDLKVAFNTIAKVQMWLETFGEGYRTVISRTEKKKDKPEPKHDLFDMKKRYPIYYWPQLLLEEIVKSANKREKERLSRVVEQLRDKTHLSKSLLKLLK